MSTKSAIAFFLTSNGKPPRRAKPPTVPPRSGLTKADEAEIRAYFQASADERKAILHAQAVQAQKDKLVARRKWRRNYQRRYRDMAAMASVII
jgi:hypothetical protein